METSVSAFRQHAGYEPAMDLTGFEVRASDGRLGTIDGSLADGADGAHGAEGRDRPTTRTQPVLLPVSAIVSIDLTDRVVYLDRTRAQIRDVRSAGGPLGVCYLLRQARAEGREPDRPKTVRGAVAGG